MRVILTVILCLSVSLAHADYGPYRAELIRVIDGDTIVVDVQIWPDLRYRATVRLAGVNAPELRRGDECERAAARRAKAFVEAFLASGDIVIDDVTPGRLGRMIAAVKSGARDLGQALLDAGLARPFTRGGWRPWCRQ